MNKEKMSPGKGSRRVKSSMYSSQCETFKHLGVSESLKYNWARRYTDSQTDGSAKDIAKHVNALDVSILILLAESPRTRGRTLEVLALNSNPCIRQAVADNPHTPKETLLLLAKDEDPEVRYAMAENFNMPMEVLEILSHDDNPFVHVRAVETISHFSSKQ